MRRHVWIIISELLLPFVGNKLTAYTWLKQGATHKHPSSLWQKSFPFSPTQPKPIFSTPFCLFSTKKVIIIRIPLLSWTPSVFAKLCINAKKKPSRQALYTFIWLLYYSVLTPWAQFGGVHTHPTSRRYLDERSWIRREEAGPSDFRRGLKYSSIFLKPRDLHHVNRITQAFYFRQLLALPSRGNPIKEVPRIVQRCRLIRNQNTLN